MRELKFRAWDSSIVFPMRGPFNLKQIIELDSVTIDESVIVMQYTGLKDKNGIEIYEGDILSYTKRGHEPYVSEVIWDEVMCKFEFFKKLSDFGVMRNRSRHTPLTWPDKMEVIGNIYENPELLK